MTAARLQDGVLNIDFPGRAQPCRIFLKGGDSVNRFFKIHPTVQLVYFALNLIIVMTVSNPFFSAAALAGALAYSVKLNKKQSVSDFKLSLIMLVLVSLFNMLFVHYGDTTLFTLGNTQFTLEALLYGFNQGMVLSSVIIWFVAFSKMFDSERVIYILRFAPKTALIFSMVLGFIPRFKAKLSDIETAQRCLNGGDGEKKDKVKNAINNLSALVTYCLESSIITADSMQARGYNPKAMRRGRFKWCGCDFAVLGAVLLLSVIIVIGIVSGRTVFAFQPVIFYTSQCVPAVLCFCLFEIIPLIVDLIEDLLWKKSSAKI